MAKPLKIFLWVIGGFVALIVTAAVALPLLVDPNDYRDDISEAVNAKTGRNLEIRGDLQLSVFPWLGVKLGETELSNAKGFEERPFARIEEVGVSVQLLPLLNKEIRVDTVTLRGLNLNLGVDQNGTGNWEDLIATSEAAPEEIETPESDNSFEIKSVDVAAVVVEDAALRYDDKQAKTSYSVEKVNLKTGTLRPSEPINISLSFRVTSSEPELAADVDMVSQVLLERDSGNYSVDKLKVNALVSGPAIPNEKQQVSLSGKLAYNQTAGTFKFSEGMLQAAGVNLQTTVDGRDLDKDTPQFSGRISVSEFSPRSLLDALAISVPTADTKVLSKASLSANFEATPKTAAVRDLKLKLDDSNLSGQVDVLDIASQRADFNFKLDQIDADRYLPPKAEGEQAEGEAGGADINATPIPAELLDQLNARGQFEIGKLTLSGLKFEQVTLKIDALKGKLKQQQLQAKLYGGQITETATLEPGPQPKYRTQATLTSVEAGKLLKDFLGKDYVTGVTSLSLDLTGSGKTVGDLRRSLNGTLQASAENGSVKGFNLAQKIRKAKAIFQGQTLNENEPQETDFATITASANIVNGILKSDQLDAKNPLFRLTGSGQVDLVKETINYLAKPTVVETTKGQGGKDLEELRGITIPIKVTGALTDPKVRLDIESALKQKATEEVRGKLKDKEDELKDKLRNKLGDFLKPKGG